jgi:hypothetical protein
MGRIKKIYTIIILLSILRFSAHAQSRSVMEDQGYEQLNIGDYEAAYYTFDKLNKKYPKEMDYEFKLGIAALNFGEKKERAIEIFQSIKTKYKTTEAEIYLGKAYHRNYKFDEAIIILQPLVEILEKSKKKEDRDYIPEVRLILKNCLNGKFLIQNKVVAEIQNIGPPINTNELEGVPVITADESMMIFTYLGKKSLGGKLNAEMRYDPNGSYLTDIYASYKDSATGQWKKPVALETVNSKGNDAAIAISPDGLTMFTFLSNNENEGDILVSQLTGTVFSAPTPLNANINTPEYWEGSCSISADGKHFYFSSERPGGLGGRDIWVCEKVDGDWGPAVNLGASINTEYDDDAPFIHADGITLFFSSKGHMSIGGYDIMFSIKNGAEWTEPKSMGIPLNTTEDDSYYVINSKGDKGFFSSTRTGSGGFGSQDIYMVTPGILGEKPVVALLKGIVYGNEKPIEARIDVIKSSVQENIGPYFSNAATGKYLTALSPGFLYRIIVSADGYDPVQEEMDITELEKFIDQNKDFYLYSKEFSPSPELTAKKAQQDLSLVALKAGASKKEEAVAKEEPAKESEPEPVKEAEADKVAVAPVITPKQKNKQEAEPETEKKADPEPESEPEPVVKTEPKPCDGDFRDLSELKGRSLNDKVNYKKLLAIAGTYCADNLMFKVQIGAYKKPQNFKYSKFEELGKVTSVNFPDSVTRFTQNEYSTLKLAEKHRQKLITKGIKDAWIVAYIGDKRYTLEDFIMLDFLSRPVN